MNLRPIVEPSGALDDAQRTRYSRQILLHGEEGQARVAASRVLVVGAGGLGSPALLYLAAAGVGTIGVIDHDVVDLSNLQRQVIHDSASVGSPKTTSAAAKVKALAPDIDVVEYGERLTEDNAVELLSGYDVVLDGTDNFLTRYLVDAACSELSIPEVWGSILRYCAQISVFWTGGRAESFGVEAPGVCLRDLFPSPPPPGTTPSCGEAGVMGSLCGQVGSIMAGEALKLITGVGDSLIGSVLTLDSLTNRYETIPLVGAANRPAPLKGEQLVSACDVSDASQGSVPEANVTEVAVRLARGAKLLDVRDSSERAICAIRPSIHIPLADILADPAAAAEKLPDGDGPVYVYCLGGVRSMKAAKALAAEGVEVVNVTGGLKQWWLYVDQSMPRY